MKKAFVKTSLVLSGMFPAVTAWAQESQIFDPNDPDAELPESLPQPATTFSGLIGTINLIARWMFAILMALGVVFILWAGFQYLISQGDETKIKKAKDFLIYAIVAMVVGVLAGSMSVLVQQFAAGAGE